VLGGLLVVTAALASQIPKIEVDPSVESLISSFEGDDDERAAANRFVNDFGDTDRVMVLLIKADDVLRPAPLQYLNEVTRHVEEEGWIEQVVSLTRTPMPRRIEPSQTSLSFDDLEQELFDDDPLEDEDEDAPEDAPGPDENGPDEDVPDEDAPDEDPDEFDDEDPGDDANGGSLSDLESELFGEEEDEDAAGELQADIVDALISLVEADPDRFPGGYRELGPKLQVELRADPIVDGDEVTEEDIEELKLALSQSSLIEGRLVSEDHTVAVTALFLENLGGREMRLHVEDLRAYLADHPPPDGVEVHLGGLPYLRSAIVENIRSDQVILVPLTLLVCLLLLAIALRWMPGVILPIAAVGITALMVVGAMALVGEPFNVLNNIIPTLLIIIGISDSIHLIGRYREELHRTDDKLIAGQRTVRAMAIACLLTSVTTAVGLASLIVSRTVMLRHFGLTAALGVMAAYVVTITFLPAILTWVKKPAKRRVNSGGNLEVGIMRMTAWVLARPWQILAFTGVLLAGTTYAATLLRVDHKLLDQFDANDPVSQTTRLLEDELDGVRPLEVSLTTADPDRFYDPDLLAAVDAVATYASGRDEVLATMSQNEILRQTLFLLSEDETARSAPFVNPAQVQALSRLLEARAAEANPLGAWVTPDRDHLRLQIKVRDVGAQATMRFITDLEAELRGALPDDVTVTFTGEAYDGSVGTDAVVGDLLGSLFTAVIIIFLLLSLLFRSIRLGLLSIPPNVIPLVFTMAYMVARGIPLNVATVIIFSISLGLAVDGTIHVLARFREETRERGMRAHPALIRAARGTGRAIVVSSITLMAGFAVLLMSNFVPVRRFGELIAVTVAGCLFATLIVQPALLQVAGISPRAQKARSNAGAGEPEAAE
jgi:hypothetical protein